MTKERLSSDEIWRRGDEWYDNHIRSIVETEENIGKIITLDVETGDYEITTWLNSYQGSDKLLTKHPDAELIQIRIGYPVVDTFGGLRLMPSNRP